MGFGLNLEITSVSGQKFVMLKIYGLPTINIYYCIPLYYNKLRHKNIRTRYKKDVFHISYHCFVKINNSAVKLMKKTFYSLKAKKNVIFSELHHLPCSNKELQNSI